MRRALLVAVLSIVCCATSARAQDAGDIEYPISEPVHEALAAHIEVLRQARPDLQVFLLWRDYAANERGLSVIEAPSPSCEAVFVAASARFLRLGDERFPILSYEDITFQATRVHDPYDFSRQTAARCGAVNPAAYTVRFDLGGQFLSAGQEGVVRE
ncbi:MAG TPA: hypothetical protein VK610_00170 [Rhodothermales bacterium]|nr:hypothetical protein [Rhodothermales bacterium]